MGMDWECSMESGKLKHARQLVRHLLLSALPSVWNSRAATCPVPCGVSTICTGKALQCRWIGHLS